MNSEGAIDDNLEGTVFVGGGRQNNYRELSIKVNQDGNQNHNDHYNSRYGQVRCIPWFSGRFGFAHLGKKPVSEQNGGQKNGNDFDNRQHGVTSRSF